MSKLRRYFRSGDWVFLTHVTNQRRPILAEHAADFLDTLTIQCRRAEVQRYAWVILPDHVHLLLESGAADVSSLTRRIKLAFSVRYRIAHNQTSGRLWQLRFYDHIIRDQEDLNRHVDYIHYNPVKHGYVKDPFAWEWSSLGRFFAEGQYERNWRVEDELDGEYGE